MVETTGFQVVTNEDRVRAQSLRLGALPNESELLALTEPFVVPLSFIRGASAVEISGNIPGTQFEAVEAAALFFQAINRLQGSDSSMPHGCIQVGENMPFKWLHGNREWSEGPLWTDIPGRCAAYGGTPVSNVMVNGGIGHLVTRGGRLLMTWLPEVKDYYAVGGYLAIYSDVQVLAGMGIAEQLAAIARRADEARDRAIRQIRVREQG